MSIKAKLTYMYFAAIILVSIGASLRDGIYMGFILLGVGLLAYVIAVAVWVAGDNL